MIPEIICVSIHNNTYVCKNTILVSLRIIPLTIKSYVLDQAIKLINTCNQDLFEVKPFLKFRKVHLIITGNEVHEGLVKDGFEEIVKDKLEKYGVILSDTIVMPDNIEQITNTIKHLINKKSDFIITTGGMSVDPDDITRYAILKAGADKIYYGVAVTPGTMLQIAYFGKIPVLSVPACALYHKTTAFDLILPRILTGESLNSKDLAGFAHGGLCMECEKCNYPYCSFGKH